MHKIDIPQHVIDKVVAKRGRAHPHENLDPAKTALVVVDLQNGFMLPGVAFALVDAAREIVPNVNRLAEAVRRTGGKVFWIRNTHDEGCFTSWSNMHAMSTPAGVARRSAAMVEGSKGHELWDELVVKPEDETVQKRRYSAFIEGSSDLPGILRAQGYDTVLVTGTATNVCCESSARDAMMLNFKVVMVSDGNAADTDEEHNASLVTFYLHFGDVMDTDTLIAALERNAAGRREAAE